MHGYIKLVLVFLACLSAECAPPRFAIDASQAPELKSSLERNIPAWEQAYDLICAELASPGYEPPKVIRITIHKDDDGIADFSSSGISIAAKFVRENPDEVEPAIVHEMAHAIQGYGDDVPMWLVEGIADYLRFYRWSAGQLGHINPDRAHYWGSYRITASFLKYLVDHYDPDIVRKLNQVAREGRYKESVFKELTGRSVQVLSQEWQATLPRTPADFAPDAETDVEETTAFPPWSRLIAAGATGACLSIVVFRLVRRAGLFQTRPSQ